MGFSFYPALTKVEESLWYLHLPLFAWAIERGLEFGIQCFV